MHYCIGKSLLKLLADPRNTVIVILGPDRLTSISIDTVMQVGHYCGSYRYPNSIISAFAYIHVYTLYGYILDLELAINIVSVIQCTMTEINGGDSS